MPGKTDTSSRPAQGATRTTTAQRVTPRRWNWYPEPAGAVRCEAEVPVTAKPLTTEQAGDFARRWVWWRRHELECAPLNLVAQEKWLRDNGPAERVLPQPDRERLFAWVRERMAGLLAEYPYMHGTDYERGWLLCHIWGDLRQTLKACEALCEAAGWPS